MDDVNKIVSGLLGYLEETDQMELLPEVVELLNEEVLGQTRRVKVVSVAALTTGEVEEISGVLADKFGAQIVVETEVDPDLIGGLRIIFQDKLIDLSVLGRLKKIARGLKN